tara:strand:- start:609 stop:878 length:270 start_codon:yes stop_codon:yes gene_type:complete
VLFFAITKTTLNSKVDATMHNNNSKLTKQQQQQIILAWKCLHTLTQLLTTLSYMRYEHNNKRIYDVTHWEQAIESIEEDLCESFNANGI